LLIEGTYLVPADSPITGAAEVDRPGMRIGASTGSAYHLFLKRELKNAQMVEAGNPAGAFQLIRDGKVDVTAGVRQNLMANAAELPGFRVLADSFMAIGQAMGMPKGRGEAAKSLREFVEDVKTSGFVARALARSGHGDVPVAPPAVAER
jgi:polar amino acid transport system substrate-binding protein